MKKELLDTLTKEQIDKIRNCKNMEETLAIAKEDGFELTDEQLESVSGGACTCWDSCPNCHGDWINYINFGSYRRCQECGYIEER